MREIARNLMANPRGRKSFFRYERVVGRFFVQRRIGVNFGTLQFSLSTLLLKESLPLAPSGFNVAAQVTARDL